MNHWLFIAAAYGLTLTALASVLLLSWRAMRAAEARARAVVGSR